MPAENPVLQKSFALLARPALEYQRGVGAAKSKRIRKRVVHCMFSGMIRDVIQITFGIGIKLVDRRRQNPVAQGQHADTGFESACSAEQVPRHRFRRAYRKLLLHRRSEEHTSELQSPCNLVCRLLLEKKKP